MSQRLVTNAEEVAYNDPPAGAAEQMILNQHLYRLLRHCKLSAFQRFLQQALNDLDVYIRFKFASNDSYAQSCPCCKLIWVCFIGLNSVPDAETYNFRR